MSNTNVKSQRSAASLISKIAQGVLVASLIGIVLAFILKLLLEEGTPLQAVSALASTVCLWAAVASLVVYLVCNPKKVWAWLKERLRKIVVALKRNPSVIPLLTLMGTFLFYSLNLTFVSNTTAKIQGAGMGLAQFCIMLLSLLSMVCLLNAFPRRKKPNIPMLVLMFVMFGIIVYCDIHYSNAIMAAMYRPVSPIKVDKSTMYIVQAYNMLSTHMILMIVTAVLVATVPVYGKLLRKINTSVQVEDNGEMAQIELND